jgi:hypothetical protein
MATSLIEFYHEGSKKSGGAGRGGFLEVLWNEWDEWRKINLELV